MPMPMLNKPLSAYDLITRSVQEIGGYQNLKEFYDTAFTDKYAGVKWRSLFSEGDPSIEETWAQVKGKSHMPVMASYVAFDSEAPRIATEGFGGSTGNMPRMVISTDYNEKSLRDGLKIANNFGGRPQLDRIYRNFVTGNADLISGLHSTINYTAFQIESKGYFETTNVNNGNGPAGLRFDFGVPAEHKKSAGGYGAKGKKAAWSSNDAFPIGDLQDMYKFAEDSMVMVDVFRMDKRTWDLLVDHPTTKRLIAIKTTGGAIDVNNIPDYPVDDQMVKDYLTRSLNLPPVEVVDEISVVQCYDTIQRKIAKKPLRGFEPGTVVLRRSGIIGQVQWSLPTLEFSTESNPVFTVENGMFQIQNTTWTKERAREIKGEFTGIPVLDNADEILYLDVTKASA